VIDIRGFDKALECIVGLGGLGIKDSDTYPIYVAVWVFVDGALKGLLAFGKVLLLQVA